MNAAKRAPVPVRAYIALGSNVGDAQATTRAALQALEEQPEIRSVRSSSLYETEPVGCPGEQPNYINAVAEIRTTQTPQELIATLQGIERSFGRIRGRRKNMPRTLDLDLLIYDDVVQTTPGLTLPHPRMHKRAFVLEPLAELDAGLTLPGGRPITDLLASCPRSRLRRIDHCP